MVWSAAGLALDDAAAERRVSSHTACTCPASSIRIEPQPRVPGAPEGLIAVDAAKDRPRSRDKATRISVPDARLDVHNTATVPFRTATRGACCSDAFTSPATSLARTAGPNVAPESVLMATNA